MIAADVVVDDLLVDDAIPVVCARIASGPVSTTIEPAPQALGQHGRHGFGGDRHIALIEAGHTHPA